jgi:hypothetical protein
MYQDSNCLLQESEGITNYVRVYPNWLRGAVLSLHVEEVVAVVKMMNSFGMMEFYGF